jgi:hypothetical protein
MAHAEQKVTTAAQLAAYIGKRGTLVTAAERLTVEVVVEDARLCFGRTDLYCVTDGVSEGAWIDRSRVILPQEAR